jgi:ubiquinone/menaquinone biosynthesis C-methylase UbiE
MSADITQVVQDTQDYYDGPADEIYRTLWQDNVHLGTWESADESLQVAMDRTNRIMAAQAGITAGSEVLDVGCGYGETARFLAEEYGARVTGTNISEKELALARERAAGTDLGDALRFEYGDFHNLPYPDGSYDVIWSQEAFLHGVDKQRILDECHRVLRPGGRLVISDLLARPHLPDDERERIYARLRLHEMWSDEDYVAGLTKAGFDVETQEDWAANVAPTYSRVVSGVREQYDALAERVPTEQLDNTIAALDQWVESAEAGKISQGFFVAVKR